MSRISGEKTKAKQKQNKKTPQNVVKINKEIPVKFPQVPPQHSNEPA